MRNFGIRTRAWRSQNRCRLPDRRQTIRHQRVEAVSSVAIHYLSASAADASKLAARLAIPAHEISVHIFPDGELRVSAWPAPAISILYAALDRPNDKLLALLFAAES